jgi:hypothetical protein
LHIRHAAVAVADGGFHTFTVGRAEPSYVAVSIFPLWSRLLKF